MIQSCIQKKKKISTTFASMLVSYTAEDTKAIRDSRLPGVMFSDYNKREAR